MREAKYCGIITKYVRGHFTGQKKDRDDREEKKENACPVLIAINGREEKRPIYAGKGMRTPCRQAPFPFPIERDRRRERRGRNHFIPTIKRKNKKPDGLEWRGEEAYNH